MQQLTLARQAEFQRYGKKTRREQFLEEMEAVMPWAELLSLVAPYYSKGETGRKPVGLAIMLRVYFLQQWFSLSDPAAEDALYESSVLRRFAGVGFHPAAEDLSAGAPDLGRAPAPDETTILKATASASRQARSSTRRSSMRPARPRTKSGSAIRRCIRRAKEISGTSE